MSSVPIDLTGSCGLVCFPPQEDWGKQVVRAGQQNILAITREKSKYEIPIHEDLGNLVIPTFLSPTAENIMSNNETCVFSDLLM